MCVCVFVVYVQNMCIGCVHSLVYVCVQCVCVCVCVWCMYKICALDVCIVGYMCVFNVCVCVCMLGAFASINNPECLCMFVHSNKQLFT